MSNFIHPFSKGLPSNGCTSFDGEYHFTPQMSSRGERHCHDHYELYIHLQGGELFSLESELVPMTANQLVIIPPYAMHGLIYDQPLQNYERMFLNVSPATLAAAGGSAFSFTELFQKATAHGGYFFTLSAEDAQLCKRLILQMQEAKENAAPIRQFDAHLYMLQYLQTIAHAVHSAEPAAEQALAYPLIQQVMNYLDGHFTEPVSLREVAGAFHISVSYLCHEFSRYNRHSIYDYVLYRRATMACELIRQGGTLTEIAYQCGFTNYNSFTRAFRKFLGMTPREYARSKGFAP